MSDLCMKEHTSWAGVEENTFRYTGNDDPTAAEGLNGLRTKDKIKRKTHTGSIRNTHQTWLKKGRHIDSMAYPSWAVAEAMFVVGGPLII